MSILVLYPKIAKQSAKELANYINADALNPFESTIRNYNNYDHVFNYGCNRNIVPHRSIINKPSAVAKCIDKVQTFLAMQAVGAPHPAFTTNKSEVPNTWKSIVIRKNRFGAQAKDLIYKDRGETLPDGDLYTEWYKHKFEFRVVVFRGQVIGRYLKEEETGTGRWCLNSMDPLGFEQIEAHCVNSARALGIDYCGFDVLAKDQTHFTILEANSAPIITADALTSIKSYYESL